MNRVLKKIAKKLLSVLPVPKADWTVKKVVKFYETVQDEKELALTHRKQGTRLNFSHYLPGTEERIERLRRVVNKRPVAIILHGPSAKELEARITELRDCDICYFSLNAFRIPEEHILQKINRNLSLVMYTAIAGLKIQIKNVMDFLEREEDNIFISARESFYLQEMPPGFDLDEFIKKYDKKLLFFTPTYTVITLSGRLLPRVPSIVYPLHFPAQGSFSILLSLALMGEAPLVTIFGGDGGRIEGQELFYKEYGDSYGVSKPEAVVERGLMTDTRLFNATMPVLSEEIYKIYNLKPVDIINCSERSNYTPLRKLSYDETFAILKSFGKDTAST